MLRDCGAQDAAPRGAAPACPTQTAGMSDPPTPRDCPERAVADDIV